MTKHICAFSLFLIWIRWIRHIQLVMIILLEELEFDLQECTFQPNAQKQKVTLTLWEWLINETLLKLDIRGARIHVNCVFVLYVSSVHETAAGVHENEQLARYTVLISCGFCTIECCFIVSATIRCMTHKHSSALKCTNEIALIRVFHFFSVLIHGADVGSRCRWGSEFSECTFVK